MPALRSARSEQRWELPWAWTPSPLASSWSFPTPRIGRCCQGHASCSPPFRLCRKKCRSCAKGRGKTGGGRATSTAAWNP
eukprot:11027676-Lingulodinium_polyedra.AAC.1